MFTMLSDQISDFPPPPPPPNSSSPLTAQNSKHVYTSRENIPVPLSDTCEARWFLHAWKTENYNEWSYIIRALLPYLNPCLTRICFFFAESRAELACSSSAGSAAKRHQGDQDYCHYSRCLLRLLRSCHFVCSGRRTRRKPDRRLVFIPDLVRPLLFDCCESHHLLPAKQPISLRLQAVPQRSLRIKRLQRQAKRAG